MWQVSDGFMAALRGPHKMVTTVDVLDATGLTVAGGLNVVGGSLVRDRKALNYGRCSLTIADPDMTPLTQEAELGPAGFEVYVQRGIEFPDGSTEMVPLGIFPIQDSTVDGVSLVTTIEAVDRSQRISDARLETDRRLNTWPSNVVETLVGEVIPDVDIDTSSATPADTSVISVYEAGSDRWEICQDVGKAYGRETYFDGLGRCIIRDEPDVSTSPSVWTVDEGDGGVLVSVDLAWSRRPSYNRAIVTGTNTEFGVTYRGVATDSSPASPSYYSGNFGPKPIFYFSPHVTSTATAGAAARALLRSKQGVAMSLDFSAIPNPALEPGDVVVVRRAALGLDLPVVVDSITLGLGPNDAMTCQVRARQEDEIEV